LFISTTLFCVVNPWKSQYGNPDDGTCTPHCATLPEPSFFVSFFA
jgi:hypothetical protein